MTRDEIRSQFPHCADITEQFRAVFGSSVKPLYFSENGKKMGRQQEFAGTDIDKLIRLDDMTAARNKKANRV